MIGKIKVVIFDWGGTLGKQGHRQLYLYSKSLQKKLSALKHDTLDILRYLKRKGYVIGLLSNTQYSREDMEKALKETKLDHYFNFAIYSSDIGVCRKPCKDIFDLGFDLSKKFDKSIKKGEVLYVGDSYRQDVLGAKDSGMKSAFVTNDNVIQEYIADLFEVHDYLMSNVSDLKDIL